MLDGLKWYTTLDLTIPCHHVHRAANLWVWNKRRFGLDKTASKSSTISITFHNDRDTAVDLYWSATKMATIQAHESAQYNTFDKHEWKIKVEDEVLLHHRIDKSRGTVQSVHV